MSFLKPIIPQKVSKRRLREIWNDATFQRELLRRTTQRVDVAEGLAPPGAGQMPGTTSHVYDFVDNQSEELLGTFHVYRRPDGLFGASGMYDPIFLLVNGVPHVDP
jgi:hypothetical protein